jgi:pantetheine-phosphate adenylyltransferase
MTAVYPGSFDPVTYGHLDIIRRAAKITDRLIVAVASNSAKKPMFSVDERLEMMRAVCAGIPGVEVASFSGLLVEFAKKSGAVAIIRGLRALTDFEYEFQMALANRMLDENIETLFISTNVQYSFISSSLVKEIALLGGDAASMTPKIVFNNILQKISGL